MDNSDTYLVFKTNFVDILSNKILSESDEFQWKNQSWRFSDDKDIKCLGLVTDDDVAREVNPENPEDIETVVEIYDLLDQENGIIVFQAPVKKIPEITKKLKEYKYCVFLDNGDFDYVGRELNGKRIVLVEFQTKKRDEGYSAIIVDKNSENLEKSYATIDNGGKSFYVSVRVKSGKIDVEVRHYNSKFRTKFENVNKVFIGDDTFDLGNSILISLGENQYVFVGDDLYSFTAPEEITEYYSEVGNSSVTYPVAGSKNYIYFMVSEDSEYIPRTEFGKNVNLFGEAYEQYYGHTFSRETKESMKKKGTKFQNFKMIKEGRLNYLGGWM